MQYLPITIFINISKQIFKLLSPGRFYIFHHIHQLKQTMQYQPIRKATKLASEICEEAEFGISLGRGFILEVLLTGFVSLKKISKSECQ